MPNLNLRVKLKKDTASNWQQSDPVLLDGELIIVTTAAGDTRFKVGNGTAKFSQLPFVDEAVQQTLTQLLSSSEGKLDSNQGTSNSGKFLTVGSNGIVAPTVFASESDTDNPYIFIDESDPFVLLVASDVEPTNDDVQIWFDTSEPEEEFASKVHTHPAYENSIDLIKPLSVSFTNVQTGIESDISALDIYEAFSSGKTVVVSYSGILSTLISASKDESNTVNICFIGMEQNEVRFIKANNTETNKWVFSFIAN